MSLKFKSFAALALSAAMMFSVAACGTTDSGDAKSDSKAKNTTVGYDVSTIKKDDELAKLAASAKTVKDGELSVGMELSYAPAEFYAEDGKTPVGYDVDMSKAIAQTLGLKPKIVSSMFDTIVPSIGSKYDLGITAMTITEERRLRELLPRRLHVGRAEGQPEEARHLRHVRREDRSADRHRPGGRGQQDRQGLQG